MNGNSITVRKPGTRIADVQRLLLPLRPRSGNSLRTVSACAVARTNPSELVIATFDGTKSGNYRDWFFRTPVLDILAQYFEEWTADPTLSRWELRQACLHIVRMTGPRQPPLEVLAVHCEPAVTGNSVKDRLKKGPHVHLKQAGDPLAHAHIPLNYSHLPDVLGSLTTLTTALDNAVQIALTEVVHADWR
jgi:hypothetical protein